VVCGLRSVSFRGIYEIKGQHHMPIDFDFIDDQIINTIKFINRDLIKAGVNSDAEYSVQLRQDVLFPEEKGYMYCLSLTRQERSKSRRQPGLALEGSIQMVCSCWLEFLVRGDTGTFNPEDMTIRLNRYAAAESLHDKNRYCNKQYEALLVHLSVFCGACRFKRMHILESDPDIAKLYTLYDKWSNSQHSADDASTSSLSHFRCIDAASNRMSKVQTLMFLKMEADEEVDRIVESFTENARTYLNSCLPPYSV